MVDRNHTKNNSPIKRYDVYPVHLIFSEHPYDIFSTMGARIAVPKNQIIHLAGDTPTHCYYIQSGRIMAYEYTSSGEEHIYNVNDAGTLLFESAIILDRSVSLSFKTIAPSVLIKISKETLLQEITANPKVAFCLLQSLSEKFTQVNEQIREASGHDAGWRVANLLITFAHRYGVDYDGKILIKDKISQQLIANLLRINRITVIRTMKELKDLGFVESINGFYCIRDLDGLLKHMKYMESTT